MQNNLLSDVCPRKIEPLRNKCKKLFSKFSASLKPFFFFIYFIEVQFFGGKHLKINYSTLNFLQLCFYTFFCTNHRRGAVDSRKGGERIAELHNKYTKFSKWNNSAKSHRNFYFNLGVRLISETFLMKRKLFNWIWLNQKNTFQSPSPK